MKYNFCLNGRLIQFLYLLRIKNEDEYIYRLLKIYEI